MANRGFAVNPTQQGWGAPAPANNPSLMRPAARGGARGLGPRPVGSGADIGATSFTTQRGAPPALQPNGQTPSAGVQQERGSGGYTAAPSAPNPQQQAPATLAPTTPAAPPAQPASAPSAQGGTTTPNPRTPPPASPGALPGAVKPSVIPEKGGAGTGSLGSAIGGTQTAPPAQPTTPQNVPPAAQQNAPLAVQQPPAQTGSTGAPTAPPMTQPPGSLPAYPYQDPKNLTDLLNTMLTQQQGTGGNDVLPTVPTTLPPIQPKAPAYSVWTDQNPNVQQALAFLKTNAPQLYSQLGPNASQQELKLLYDQAKQPPTAKPADTSITTQGDIRNDLSLQGQLGQIRQYNPGMFAQIQPNWTKDQVMQLYNQLFTPQRPSQPAADDQNLASAKFLLQMSPQDQYQFLSTADGNTRNALLLAAPELRQTYDLQAAQAYQAAIQQQQATAAVQNYHLDNPYATAAPTASGGPLGVTNTADAMALLRSGRISDPQEIQQLQQYMLTGGGAQNATGGGQDVGSGMDLNSVVQQIQGLSHLPGQPSQPAAGGSSALPVGAPMQQHQMSGMAGTQAPGGTSNMSAFNPDYLKKTDLTQQPWSADEFNSMMHLGGDAGFQSVTRDQIQANEDKFNSPPADDTPTWASPGTEAGQSNWKYDLAKGWQGPGVGSDVGGTQVDMGPKFDPRTRGAGYNVLMSPPGAAAPVGNFNYTPDTNEMHGPGMTAPRDKMNLSLVPA